jgi:hypothetical protein
MHAQGFMFTSSSDEIPRGSFQDQSACDGQHNTTTTSSNKTHNQHMHVSLTTEMTALYEVPDEPHAAIKIEIVTSRLPRTKPRLASSQPSAPSPNQPWIACAAACEYVIRPKDGFCGR